MQQRPPTCRLSGRDDPLSRSVAAWTQIPCGIRVDGLPPVCRQIIQLVVSVQQLAGQEGVDELQVVLTVGGDEEDFVCSMLREHEFYG